MEKQKADYFDHLKNRDNLPSDMLQEDLVLLKNRQILSKFKHQYRQIEEGEKNEGGVRDFLDA